MIILALASRAIRILLAVCIAALLLTVHAPGFAQTHIFRDNTPRIAVVSAFAPEMNILTRELQNKSEHSANGVKFATGTLEGHQVVLFLSGISVVNAAMTVQLALDRFAIESIVFSGIAGGVDPSLSIGDVVVGERWGQYLEMLFAREINGDYATLPFFTYPYQNYGMMFPRAVTVLRAGTEGPETRFWFPADRALLAATRRAAHKVTLAHCTADDRCLDRIPRLNIGGSGVSGGVFVDNAAFREWVFETFDARILDMESAAVAHVAYANDVPFLAVRSLSDLAGGSQSTNQMEVFLDLAAGNAAEVVRAILREIPIHR